MMTKREIIKWLDGKRSDALNSSNAAKMKAIADYKAKRAKDTNAEEVVRQVTELMAQANTIVNQWLRKVNQDFPDYKTGNTYCSHLSTKTYMPESSVRSSLLLHFIDTDMAIKSINTQYKDIAYGINRNYDAVIENVRVQPTNKAAVSYLKEIGFDTSDLEQDAKNPCTALSVPVDTRFLFFKKEEGN